MRYLITGGAGFIGSHLADRLVATGDNVVIVDDLKLIDGLMADCDCCLHLASTDTADPQLV